MTFLDLIHRFRNLSVLIFAMGLLLVAGLGWWAANRIDDGALQRQIRSINRGLTELEVRVPFEQDTSAVWNEAVVNLRAGNQDWIADNLAEWVSSYFGHDRVHLLDPRNEPMRSVSLGELRPIGVYDADRAVVEPMVMRLRAEMAMVSAGQSDSTDAIVGLGSVERARLADGEVGIVSIRPVVPDDSEELAQRPGEEFLHVSVKLIDASVSAAIAEQYGIADLNFASQRAQEAGRAHTPVLASDGETLGYFSWEPFRPATQLMRETAPVLGATLIIVLFMFALLLRHLDKTSARLRLSEAEANYLAFHDQLARIPNRFLFEDRLNRAIANRKRSGARLALLSIDLDRFKYVNDTLGHPVGDELIRQVGSRLTDLVSEVDTVARIGGDEFAVLQVAVEKSDDAVGLGQRIVDEMERPFDLLDHEVRTGCSVGIAYSEDVNQDPDDLIRQADIALYEAKANGRGRLQVFAGELDNAVRDRRALEQDLREALNGGTGLTLAYQPIYDTVTGSILGAEALVRWEHTSRGRLSPDKFIGLAEERGLINQLGLWVLRTAGTYALTSDIPWVAVNVSPVQFRDDRFAQHVFAMLEEIGLPPQRLEIEITEGLLLQNSPGIQQTLRTLRAGGIRIALDDFGTGYSSISYLRTYGVDKLKIDQSFVAQLGRDTEVDSIVRAIIDLAKAMNMTVTAEGVETVGQRGLLEKLGCGQLQGYLLSRPMPAEALTDLLRDATRQSA
ncbi:putative bifunctional diguanylate cyclase/phosphodiesterase [Devosia salina]|uniref:EAL domain-containing protein n=1 Tax=Devosia salina TaxID=2860336 RepID=A0ABX8WFZ6_9HYPH|nr:EAL domain-containing protein [Devosia salina]QYO75652.1 EAL domain-containing protein [Devosia salina]